MAYENSKAPKAQRKKSNSRKTERSAALRLLAAAMIFSACLVGKRSFPERTKPYFEKIAQTLTADTDFQEAFAELGQRIGGGEELLNAAGEWCVEVFQPVEMSEAETKRAEDNQREERSLFMTWDENVEALKKAFVPEA